MESLSREMRGREVFPLLQWQGTDGREFSLRFGGPWGAFDMPGRQLYKQVYTELKGDV